MKMKLSLGALTQEVLETDADWGKTSKKNDVAVDRSYMKSFTIRSSNKEETRQYECDPSSNGIDTGLLPCGKDQFCSYSETSILGGVCFPARLKKETRSLQECPIGYNDLGCDCSNYIQGVGGPITDCVTYSNYCVKVDVFSIGSELCFDLVYDLVVKDTSVRESLNVCYFLSAPYSRDFCLNYIYDTDGRPTRCEIIIDGVPCDSCTLTACDSTSNDYLNFDCTNTVVGTSGSECNDELPVPILNFVSIIDESPTSSPAPVSFPIELPTSSPTSSPVAETTKPSALGTLEGTISPTKIKIPTMVTTSATTTIVPNNLLINDPSPLPTTSPTITPFSSPTSMSQNTIPPTGIPSMLPRKEDVNSLPDLTTQPTQRPSEAENKDINNQSQQSSSTLETGAIASIAAVVGVVVIVVAVLLFLLVKKKMNPHAPSISSLPLADSTPTDAVNASPDPPATAPEMTGQTVLQPEAVVVDPAEVLPDFKDQARSMTQTGQVPIVAAVPKPPSTARNVN